MAGTSVTWCRVSLGVGPTVGHALAAAIGRSPDGDDGGRLNLAEAVLRPTLGGPCGDLRAHRRARPFGRSGLSCGA